MKVSVVMITYNHEKFIEKAINGVLMQECDFDIEFIISNDCSWDNTDKLINNILSSHPHSSWIKYYNHKKNLGAANNFSFAMKQATGDYIALCEGDDYWTDKLKLQKQVDFLELNTQYSVVGHAINIIDLKHNTNSTFSVPGVFKQQDLIINYPISTLSSLFRRSDFTYYNWLSTMPLGDMALWMIVLKDRLGYNLSEIMGTHVGHEGGVWHHVSSETQIKMFKKTATIFLENESVLEAPTKKLLIKKLKKIDKKDTLFTSFFKKVYFKIKLIFNNLRK